MDGKVIFFPVTFWPDFRLQNDLYRVQAEFRNAYRQIEEQERNDRYNEVIRKQNLACHLRSMWEVIDCTEKETQDKYNGHTHGLKSNL